MKGGRGADGAFGERQIEEAPREPGFLEDDAEVARISGRRGSGKGVSGPAGSFDASKARISRAPRGPGDNKKTLFPIACYYFKLALFAYKIVDFSNPRAASSYVRTSRNCR